MDLLTIYLDKLELELNIDSLFINNIIEYDLDKIDEWRKKSDELIGRRKQFWWVIGDVNLVMVFEQVVEKTTNFVPPRDLWAFKLFFTK